MRMAFADRVTPAFERAIGVAGRAACRSSGKLVRREVIGRPLECSDGEAGLDREDRLVYFASVRPAPNRVPADRAKDPDA
jgi:hypothetical protein